MTFFLCLEYGRPAAALLPTRVTAAQLRTIYALLPENATHDQELADRWNLALVCCDPQWAREQKRRVPMTKPKTLVGLSFYELKS